MRQKHLKFHAAALTAICSLIVVLYVLLGPKDTGPAEEVIGDRFVTIDNATWGKNCDPYIQSAINDWRMPAPGEKGLPKPAYAQYNNARDVIRSQCDHKLSCNVLATSDTLGVEPLQACAKRLTVAYRCFQFDRLNTVETAQGATLQIDCREGATPPAAAK